MSHPTRFKTPLQYMARGLQVACIFSAPLLVQSANAAVASDEKSNALLEEVIVTAAKRNQALSDFSGSITVIKMDSLNPGATLKNIASQVPSFSIIENGSRNVSSITMRGLRMDSVDSNDFIGDGSIVAAYVDNIPLQGFFVPPAISFKDLQQIEILRGPQGTLYGNASIGGLVRYISAKPDLTEKSVKLTTGISSTQESHGLSYDTDVVANLPIIDNELAARLLFAKAENQGFIDNDGSLLTGAQQDINEDKTQQVRASVLWQPNEDFSLNGSYDYQKNRVEDRQASNETFTGDEYTASNHYAQPLNGVLRLASVDATYNLGWANVTASVNQSDYTAHTIGDQTDFLLTTYSDYYSGYPDFSAFTQSQAQVIKDSAELRFVSPDDQPLRWLAGTFFSVDDLDITIADITPGFMAYYGEEPFDDIDYFYSQKEKLSEQSIYAEVAYDLTSAWEASIGARYFREKDEVTACTAFYPVVFPLDCVADDAVENGSLGKFTTKYKFNTDHTIYLAIAEGFRRGGTNYLPLETASNRKFNADTNINYEVGNHSKFMQGKIKLNTAIFYIDWSDVQVGTYNVDGYGIVANAGSARSVGFELDSEIQLLEALSAVMNYSYVDAEISESVADINGDGGSVNKGDRLPGSSREQWSIGFDYKRTVNLTTWNAGLHYAHNDAMKTAVNNSFADYSMLDSSGVMNAQLGAAIENWYFSVYVNNLANERIITKNRTPFYYGDQGRFEYINRPRTVGLTMSYTF